MHYAGLAVLVAATVAGICSCQNCTLPLNDDLKLVIVVADDNFNTSDAAFYPLCLVFDHVQHCYRAVSSVIKKLNYTCYGSSSCPLGSIREQIVLECVNGTWFNVVLPMGTRNNSHSQTEADFSTTARGDCSFCETVTTTPSVPDNERKDRDSTRECDCVSVFIVIGMIGVMVVVITTAVVVISILILCLKKTKETKTENVSSENELEIDNVTTTANTGINTSYRDEADDSYDCVPTKCKDVDEVDEIYDSVYTIDEADVIYDCVYEADTTFNNFATKNEAEATYDNFATKDEADSTYDCLATNASTYDCVSTTGGNDIVITTSTNKAYGITSVVPVHVSTSNNPE